MICFAARSVVYTSIQNDFYKKKQSIVQGCIEEKKRENIIGSDKASRHTIKGKVRKPSS